MQILSPAVSEPVMNSNSGRGIEIMPYNSASRIHSPLSVNTIINTRQNSLEWMGSPITCASKFKANIASIVYMDTNYTDVLRTRYAAHL
jgi:hypothetical protein